MKKAIKLFANTNIVIGILLMALPVVYLIAVNTPQIWYRVNPNAVQDEIAALTADPFSETFGSIDLLPKVFAEAPEKDTSLPKENTVRISKIGVDTEIIEGTNEAEALEKGVWRMPSYGSPVNNDTPIILAAHRWGPTNITAEYRNKNMFINLPQLSTGDTVEIIWDQQVYTYQIKKVEYSTYVSELSDLILITCQYFDSPERIIVYADRI